MRFLAFIYHRLLKKMIQTYCPWKSAMGVPLWKIPPLVRRARVNFHCFNNVSYRINGVEESAEQETFYPIPNKVEAGDTR